MKPIADSESDWIIRDQPWLRKGSDARPLQFVADMMPATFTAYAKILHPMALDDGSDRLIRWATVAEQAGCALDQTTTYDQLGLRVIAADAGFGAFVADKTMSWSNLLGIYAPTEGKLDEHGADRLLDLLRPSTQEPRVRWEIYASTDGQCTWEGSFDELAGVYEETESIDMPTLWWPPDARWCVALDIDTEWTLVGGPADLVMAILDDDALETMRVNPAEPIADPAATEEMWDRWKASSDARRTGFRSWARRKAPVEEPPTTDGMRDWARGLRG